jgi:hypothetical protein
MIQEVVRLLEDGMWHSFSEIKDKSNLPDDKFGEIIQFLKEFYFVDIDNKQKRVKICPSFLELPV